MLAAFQQYGIQPGPLLLERESVLVWGLIASLFIGNALLLVLNLPLAPAWAKLLQIPRPYLYAGILFFASVGAYAVNANPFDLFVLLVIGVLGFAMRRYGLPVVPAIIGVILGPRAEQQMRRAFQLSNGEISGLFNSPLAIAVYAIIAVVLLWPLVSRLLRGRRPPAPVTAAAAGAGPLEDGPPPAGHAEPEPTGRRVPEQTAGRTPERPGPDRAEPPPPGASERRGD